MPAAISARRADYTTSTSCSTPATAAAAASPLVIEPCEDVKPLADVVGALRKLKHDKNFLHKIFEKRDRELFPRDILVAYLPSKRGKQRAVGLLRRSFCFDKEKNTKALSIDFVWVMPDARSCGCGRQLMAAGLLAGKPKDVHLQVAGSEDNKKACALYSSLGFEWDSNAPKRTEMVLEAEQVLESVAAARARRQQQPPASIDAASTQSTLPVLALVAANVDGCVEPLPPGGAATRSSPEPLDVTDTPTQQQELGQIPTSKLLQPAAAAGRHAG